jgi:ribosomal protein S18 acetylase RimI-like enzyme
VTRSEVPPVLVDRVEGRWPEYLELELDVGQPYYAFVFDTREQWRMWQTASIDSGGCEFAPPWARLMLLDDRLVGMYAAIPGRDLQRIRLLAATRLLRSARALDALTRERMRLAARISMHPTANELYLSRIGIVREARGGGLGRWLLERVECQAVESGVECCVLEVDPLNEAAVNLYHRAGFETTERKEITDPASGRTYMRMWMRKSMTRAAG